MEKLSECVDCKTWEEEMYWTHFSSLHFFLTLPQNFQDHLVLPEKFASHMKLQLPDKVSLKAPNGALWKVNVLKCDEVHFIGDEWKDFVKSNNVTENDLLVFKYDRHSSFEVLIFDQGSSCEREGSYFKKKCGHFKSDHDNLNIEAAREPSIADIIEDFNEDVNEREGLSGLKAKTQSPLKNVLNAAAKCRDRPVSLILPHESPIKGKVRTRKRTIRNHSGKKRRHISQEDGVTAEGGESFPIKAQSTQDKPVRDDTANGPSPVSKRDVINTKTEDDFQTIDHSYKSNDQFEKSPIMEDNSKEPSPTIGKEHKTHDIGENSPENDQIDKDPSASGTIKLVTPISWRAPDGRIISPEEDHFRIFCSGIQKKKGIRDSMKKLVVKNVSGRKKFSSEKISNRRPITEEEKAEALRRARQKETENSFTAIMRPTSVYRRFFLNISSKWRKKHPLHLNQGVVLRVGEKTWVTNFAHYGNGGRGLYHGWKRFALENDLEEYDVLVFTPVSPSVGEAVILDVEIFRVV